MSLLSVEISNKNHVYGLDILRALSIIFVVYGHGAHMLVNYIPAVYLDATILDGVTMFFVLSGFLIGSILIKTLETNTANLPVLLSFWSRRWFRTLPNYFLVLSVLVFFHIQFRDLEFSSVTRYFFFLQNFATVHPKFFAEAWTLAIEEWFYLLVPLSFFLAVRLGLRPKTAVLWVIVTVIIGSILIRYGRYIGLEVHNIYEWDSNYRKQVVTRLDSLIFGVLGAWLSYYYQSCWTQHRKLLFIAGVLLLLSHKAAFVLQGQLGWSFNVFFCVLSFTMISLSIFMLLPLLSNLRSGSGFVYKWATIFSLTSYSMYLIHFNLVQFIAMPAVLELIPLQLEGVWLDAARFTLYWLLSILGSILIYKYFEIPTTSLRNVFTPERIRYWLGGGEAPVTGTVVRYEAGDTEVSTSRRELP